MKELYGFVIETRKILEHGGYNVKDKSECYFLARVPSWSLYSDKIYKNYSDVIKDYDELPKEQGTLQTEYRIKTLYTSMEENEAAKNEYAKARVKDALDLAADSAVVENYYPDPFIAPWPRVNRWSITSVIDKLKF